MGDGSVTACRTLSVSPCALPLRTSVDTTLKVGTTGREPEKVVPELGVAVALLALVPPCGTSSAVIKYRRDVGDSGSLL